jgi:hypothetical protein
MADVKTLSNLQALSISPSPAQTLPSEDHVALRSENYRAADQAQADRRLYYVGRIALRAFAYHGTSTRNIDVEIIQFSRHSWRTQAIVLGELLLLGLNWRDADRNAAPC